MTRASAVPRPAKPARQTRFAGTPNATISSSPTQDAVLGRRVLAGATRPADRARHAHRRRDAELPSLPQEIALVAELVVETDGDAPEPARTLHAVADEVIRVLLGAGTLAVLVGGDAEADRPHDGDRRRRLERGLDLHPADALELGHAAGTPRLV